MSGRVAWRGVAECGMWNAECRPGNAYLFCYGNGRPRTGDRQPTTAEGSGHTVSAASKLGAVIAALSIYWPVRLVLVWHLGLLKLLPFFRIPDARVVLFLHGIEAWRQQGWFTQMLLRRVNLFLSNSDYTWQRFLSFHPKLAGAPHRTVHLGIDAPVNVPTPAPTHPPAVLMISRLLRSEDYKGHQEMITAWPLVLRQIPEAELWIAGDGDLRQDLEAMVRNRGLTDRVRFWGQVLEDEKQSLLARCRCLALPSRAEGFGLVYLEAMRMGRPCLVSTVDAGREVINPPEAGLAANPTNPQELADAVCRLLSDGYEWATWARQARERYHAHFTAQHFQERLLEALFPSELREA